MKTRKRRKARITAATTATVTAVGYNLLNGSGLGLFLLAGLLSVQLIMPVQAQWLRTAFQSGEHVMYDLYFNWEIYLEESRAGKLDY